MFSCVYSFSFVNMMFSDYRTKMKAGRSSYDCGDVSVTVGEVKELLQESQKVGSC